MRSAESTSSPNVTVIRVFPGPTGVIGTSTEALPAATVSVAGTVATSGCDD